MQRQRRRRGSHATRFVGKSRSRLTKDYREDDTHRTRLDAARLDIVSANRERAFTPSSKRSKGTTFCRRPRDRCRRQGGSLSVERLVGSISNCRTAIRIRPAGPTVFERRSGSGPGRRSPWFRDPCFEFAGTGSPAAERMNGSSQDTAEIGSLSPQTRSTDHRPVGQLATSVPPDQVRLESARSVQAPVGEGHTLTCRVAARSNESAPTPGPEASKLRTSSS